MTSLAERTVAACARHPAIVIAAAAAISAAAFVYVARHMAINTDTASLIAADVAWRQHQRSFDQAFPHRSDLIAIIIDAPTPEIAEQATASLAHSLASQTDIFHQVWRPDGGPFFDQAGLLLQPLPEVERTARSLIAAQPLLGTLAADPSLRGLMDALSRMSAGLKAEPGRAGDLAEPLTKLAAVFEGVLSGQTPNFSWHELIAGKADPRELRRFILAQPVLDYRALQPGKTATDAIRSAAQALGLDSDPGLRVRLTGPVPLANEEFATIADGALLNVSIMLLAVLALLWIALHSWRLIFAIMLSLAVGLIVTAAFGLWLYGMLNLISVAFAVLFIGLGVDFGIQLCVSYRSERHSNDDLHLALRHAARYMGAPLALAAASIAAGFYAFLPTEYRGVSELGVIAGTGIIVALAVTLSLLPALIAVLRPSGEPEPVGYAALAPADRFLIEHRRWVLVLAAVIAATSVALLPRLRFDFNPLHLRSVDAESVATLLDLMRDPDTSPNTVEVLAPSLDEATMLAQRIEQLPDVARAVTLASYVPKQQDEKLALIGDASLLLAPALEPGQTKPPPTDEQTSDAMLHAAQSLEEAANALPKTQLALAASRLASALRSIAAGDAAQRERVRRMLIPGLDLTLKQLRTAMKAQPVTLATLPDGLRRDWIAADGRARIEVFPKGDSNDNAVLRRFVTAVRTIAPDATGAPVSIQDSSQTILRAFGQAGLWALLAIVLILGVALRSVVDVLLTLLPLALSSLATLGICAAIGLPLNFENIIALPLMLGIGVAFNIYFVMAARQGKRDLLQSSLARAVIFSAFTTATAFGSLWLSHHPGTSSMGELLALSLACTLVSALVFLPALLGNRVRLRSG